MVLSLHEPVPTKCSLARKADIVNTSRHMVVQRKSPRQGAGRSSKAGHGKRRYRMAARLDQMTATRRRIAAATFELHATIGPARTTISAIAERAGVQRHTVYRHFPDMVSLFEACTAHGLEVTRPPKAEAWRSIADPAERVRRGLGELYAYYRANARLMGNIIRDMPLIPLGVEGGHQFLELIESYSAALYEGWEHDPAAAAGLQAAVAHALDFWTWQSLTTQGLSDTAAADAMTVFVTVMAGRSLDAGAAEPSLVGG
jgi:AcrR family transcriptional regulator